MSRRKKREREREENKERRTRRRKNQRSYISMQLMIYKHRASQPSDAQQWSYCKPLPLPCLPRLYQTKFMVASWCMSARIWASFCIDKLRTSVFIWMSRALSFVTKDLCFFLVFVFFLLLFIWLIHLFFWWDAKFLICPTFLLTEYSSCFIKR